MCLKCVVKVLKHQHFKVFCKYWSDDGPLRPKLVANSNITINVIQLCQTEFLCSLFY